MKLLSGLEEQEAIKFMELTAIIAKDATCTRSKCGSIIVYDNKIIGQGINTPPNNLESQRRCSNSKEIYNNKVTDKTCCVHAEQRAIMDALRKNSEKIIGSRLYFIRLDKNTNEKSYSGKPYCTMCSKMALDSGVKEFVLWHKEGITVYDTKEYNDLSFEYKE